MQNIFDGEEHPPVRLRDLFRLDEGDIFKFLIETTGLWGNFDGERCKKCERGVYRIRKDKSFSSDGGCWRCSQCSHKFSLRNGTWMSGSHLDPLNVLLLTYMWTHKFSNDTIARELSLSKTTVVDWKNFCREV